jgi:hypothetical protein
MKTTARGIGLWGLVLLGTALVAHAAPRWHKAETPHFIVYSAANKAETKEIIADLELFHQTVTKTFSIKTKTERKTRIVIFGRERQLEPYKPDMSRPPDDSVSYEISPGKIAVIGAAMLDSPQRARFHPTIDVGPNSTRVVEAEMARINDSRAALTGNTGKAVQSAASQQQNQHAFAINHPDETVIVMSGESDWDDSKATLYGRHMVAMLQNAGVEEPQWFLEGMAAMMSTFYRNRETLAMGGANADLLNFVRDLNHLMPWDQFFAIANDSREYGKLGNRDWFDAQAWLLLHYCYFSEERSAEWREAMIAWIEDVKRGEGDMMELLQRHLGVSPEQLTAELLAYSQREEYQGIVSTRPATWEGKRVKLQRVEPTEAEDVLLNVRVRLTRDEEAVQELQARAERDPKDTEALRLLGVDAMLKGDESRQSDYWAQASAAGASDAVLVRQEAVAGLRQRLESLDPQNLIADEQAVVWRAQLEDALRLEPGNEITLQWLGWLEALAETPDVANMNRVQHAVNAGMAQPDFVLMAVAIMRARVGDLDTARDITSRFEGWDRWEWRNVLVKLAAAFEAESGATAKSVRAEG